MKFDKSPLWLVQLFTALQPEVGGTPRVMFGYPCGFVDGQMFAGLFGDGLFVRLGEADRAALLALPGATPFSPMPGRASTKYVVLPPSMLEDEEAVKGWMSRALAFARTLPKKPPKARKAAPPQKRKKAVPPKKAPRKRR